MAVKIFSRLDHTVLIPYGDTNLVVPPYARGLEVKEDKKLGELPKGIQIVKVKEGK